jgi:hypothetical protein
MTAICEITVFTKADGPLTKKISLALDGTVKSDGSACKMARGEAERVSIKGVKDFAELIDTFTSSQAFALGALHDDLPAKVKVVTKRELNGQEYPGIIARTGANINYAEGPAFALLDYDSKGMPMAVAAQLKQHGGFWPALLSVLPALADVARVTRASTSAGLYRSDTGERLPGDESEAHSIEGFCRKHGFSIAFYYELRKAGLTPREVTLGRRVLVTKEDAAAWRAALAERKTEIPDAA